MHPITSNQDQRHCPVQTDDPNCDWREKTKEQIVLQPTTRGFLTQFLNLMHLCNFVFSPKRFAWRWKLFILAKRRRYKRIRADPCFPCLDLCLFSFFLSSPLFFLFYLPLPWNLTYIRQLTDNCQGLKTTLERTIPSAAKMRCTSDSEIEAWKPTYLSHSNHKFCICYR